MKFLPWIVGLLILAVAGLFIALAPRDHPPAATQAPAANGAAVLPVGVSIEPLRPGRDPSRPYRAAWSVIEQRSSIVGADGALTQAVGLETTPGDFRRVIPSGEATPVTRTLTLGTAVADQSEMRVHLYRGNSDRVAENQSLGWFVIGDIPAGPARTTMVTLVLKVADDAIVGTAVAPDTGRPLTFGASDPPPAP